MRLLPALVYLTLTPYFPLPAKASDVLERISKIQTKKPKTLPFKLSEPLPEGGHLQGIQAFHHAGKKGFLLSGSSADFSYFLKVPVLSETGEPAPRTATMHRLLPAPYRHAGGFQMLPDSPYAAVGIEDNQRKDRSVVWIVNLVETPGDQPLSPIVEIKRAGKKKESTAGAVAIIRHNGRYLLIVGSWDSATLDFYHSKEFPLTDPRFRFEEPIIWKAADADRSAWVNQSYGSYQNLNLIIDEASGNLHLAGFCLTGDRHLLDLFELPNPFQSPPRLIKRSTHHFACDQSTFRAGAGLQLTRSGERHLLACDHRKPVIERFDPLP